MTTVIASPNTARLDGFIVSWGGDTSTTWLYTEIIEESVTLTNDQSALRGADYPLLAAIWDNEDDAVYDDL